MKRIVSVSYSGNCPTCNEEQESLKPENVDKLCFDCAMKISIEEETKNKYKILEGGTIYRLSWFDEKDMPTVIDIIKNDTVYSLRLKCLEITGIYP